MRLKKSNIQLGLMRLAGVAAFILFTGCREGSHLDRVEVRGRVTYQGQPVDNGEIRFAPLDGTRGPVAGAPIAKGEYVVNHRGGVPLGGHRVEIEGYRKGGKSNSATEREGGIREQYLPAKYNVKSELAAQIAGSSAAQRIDYDLPK